MKKTITLSKPQCVLLMAHLDGSQDCDAAIRYTILQGMKLGRGLELAVKVQCESEEIHDRITGIVPDAIVKDLSDEDEATRNKACVSIQSALNDLIETHGLSHVMRHLTIQLHEMAARKEDKYSPVYEILSDRLLEMTTQIPDMERMIDEFDSISKLVRSIIRN